MLEFLQTGKALYVLAALCGLGTLTRWLTRNLYKRLIRESDNMSLTKNKDLRTFRQKTENTYQLNQGIPEIKPYLERQMYDFKYMGITLHGWNSFSNQMTLWCFLAGGAGAFASYWYSTDPYYIVLYGSMGIMGGLFTILVDNAAGIVEKRQQLFASLDHYLENTLIYRLNQDKEEAGEPLASHGEGRENIRSIYPPRSERDSETEAEKKLHRRMARHRGEQAEKEFRVHSRKTVTPELSGGEAETAQGEQAEPASRKDVDYLKHSLEQIAVSREKERGSKTEEDWLKDLNPDELKLIGEIIQEYLT